MIDNAIDDIKAFPEIDDNIHNSQVGIILTDSNFKILEISK